MADLRRFPPSKPARATSLPSRPLAGLLTSGRARAAVRDVSLALAGSLLVALCAQVTIYLPIGPVPLTGQTLGVLVVGALLGSRLGPAALVAYLAEGASGLPVFAPGATIGLARFVSPTAGYLFGFVVAAWIVGRLVEAGWARRLPTTFAALTVGVVAIYAAGFVGLLAFLPLDQALAVGVVPFVLVEAVKVTLAAGLVYRHRPSRP